MIGSPTYTDEVGLFQELDIVRRHLPGRCAILTTGGAGTAYLSEIYAQYHGLPLRRFTQPNPTDTAALQSYYQQLVTLATGVLTLFGTESPLAQQIAALGQQVDTRVFTVTIDHA